MGENYCTIQDPPVFTENVRRWNNETDASGNEMGADIELLVNNDAYLRNALENKTNIVLMKEPIPIPDRKSNTLYMRVTDQQTITLVDHIRVNPNMGLKILEEE